MTQKYVEFDFFLLLGHYISVSKKHIFLLSIFSPSDISNAWWLSPTAN